MSTSDPIEPESPEPESPEAGSPHCIRRVYHVRSSDQLLVSIPKDSAIHEGDFVQIHRVDNVEGRISFISRTLSHMTDETRQFLRDLDVLREE